MICDIKLIIYGKPKTANEFSLLEIIESIIIYNHPSLNAPITIRFDEETPP